MPRATVTRPVASAPDKAVPMRAIWQRAIGLLRSIAARIDLSNFPPSCCG
jgi:hypothetical protein